MTSRIQFKSAPEQNDWPEPLNTTTLIPFLFEIEVKTLMISCIYSIIRGNGESEAEYLIRGMLPPPKTQIMPYETAFHDLPASLGLRAEEATEGFVFSAKNERETEK